MISLRLKKVHLFSYHETWSENTVNFDYGYSVFPRITLIQRYKVCTFCTCKYYLTVEYVVLISQMYT